jgi:hypothetical protein
VAKLTLLEMTQRILSAMDSDSVNSIDDTVESLQVADIVRESYEQLVTQRDWKFLNEKTALTGLGDTNNPTKMEIPEGVNKVLWIKYNGQDVEYVEPKEFQDLLDLRTEQAGVVDANGFVVNRDPLYWTSFDDAYVTFDGYDSDAESTLQTANNVAYCQMVAEWTHEDGFTPLLPEKMFPTLLADAKGTAFLQLKQQANAKAEKQAREGKARHQSEHRRATAEHRTDTSTNYGRK